MPAQASLWRDRNFLLFFIGRTISVIGSMVTVVVLPILAFQLTGNALQTALLTALEVVPYLFFGLLAGAVADRVNRRTMMIVCDWINAALLMSIPIAGWLGVLTVPQLYVVGLLSATAFVWFDAANSGLLVELVGKDRVYAANNAQWQINIIVSIVVPAVGGVLVALMGAATTITLDAASYAISAITLMLLPRSLGRVLAPSTQTTGQPAQSNMMQDIREGLRFIWNHKLVRTLTLVGFGNTLTGGAINGLVVVYAVRALGLADDDARIGWLFTANAVGALVASLLLGRATQRFSVGLITLGGMLGNLVSLMALALAPNLWAALVLTAIWQGTLYVIVVNGISVRQIVAPAHMQGRVNTTARMIAWGGTPFGAAIGGALAEVLDVRVAMLIMACGVALGLVFGWFSGLHHQPKLKELKSE
jgi:MFS family permease